MADVSKVIINGNTVFDLTGVTVTPDKLVKGVIAHDKSGKKIVGTAEKTSAEPAKTYHAQRDIGLPSLRGNSAVPPLDDNTTHLR